MLKIFHRLTRRGLNHNKKRAASVMGDEFFREKVFAVMLYGFRTIKKPASVTVHPELMMKIRDQFKDTQMAPVSIEGAEMFFGLPVIEDATKGEDYIAVS